MSITNINSTNNYNPSFSSRFAKTLPVQKAFDKAIECSDRVFLQTIKNIKNDGKQHRIHVNIHDDYFYGYSGVSLQINNNCIAVRKKANDIVSYNAGIKDTREILVDVYNADRKYSEAVGKMSRGQVSRELKKLCKEMIDPEKKTVLEFISNNAKPNVHKEIVKKFKSVAKNLNAKKRNVDTNKIVIGKVKASVDKAASLSVKNKKNAKKA